MTQKSLSHVINQLARSSQKNQPTLISYQNKRLSVVVPVKNQQAFQALQDEKLRQIKVEINHMLTFVRNRLQKSSSRQAQLTYLQQQIKQETDKP